MISHPLCKLAWVLGLVLAFGVPAALAHDSWISRGQLKNAAGEWCCGAGDCAVMDEGTVGFTARGYELRGFGTIAGSAPEGDVREHYNEIVPMSEAQPSPDGAYWRCKRPDGTRRCFFAPPPNG